MNRLHPRHPLRAASPSPLSFSLFLSSSPDENFTYRTPHPLPRVTSVGLRDLFAASSLLQSPPSIEHLPAPCPAIVIAFTYPLVPSRSTIASRSRRSRVRRRQIYIYQLTLAVSIAIKFSILAYTPGGIIARRKHALHNQSIQNVIKVHGTETFR